MSSRSKRSSNDKPNLDYSRAEVAVYDHLLTADEKDAMFNLTNLFFAMSLSS
jgi:hypothetical protein